MLLTDSQGLPYPEPEDFVSSLQLQTLAEAIDAKIQALNVGFDAVNARSARIVRLSANQTGLPSGTETQVLFDTYIYGSDPNHSPNSISFDGFEAGLFMGGMYAAAQAPAPVVNTERWARLELLDYPGPAFSTEQITIWDDQSYETNTGGEDLNPVATFEVNTPEYATLTGYIGHTNGTVVTALLGTYMWVFRIGGLEV